MNLEPSNSQVLRPGPKHRSGVSNGGVGSFIESRSQEPLGVGFGCHFAASNKFGLV